MEKIIYFIINPILKMRCGNPNQYLGQSIPQLLFRLKNRGEIQWNK